MAYIFPLKQHIGVPSVPVVGEDETVRRGQLIARRPENALGSPIYSSVDGIVQKITPEEIIIAQQNCDFTEYVPLQGTTPRELIEEAGIVGLGGAGFPTYAKLDVQFAGNGTVIVNAAECEPILSHNIARIEKEPEKLLKGLAIIMELVQAGRGIIAIKGIHRDAIAALKKCNSSPAVSIAELENIYPMGEERAIIRETLGILLKPDQLPSAADAVVINAETVLRIREAVEDKKPLIDKDMTVAGKLRENGSVHVLFDVPIGTCVADVLQKVGGPGDTYGELIMGGPFTGKRTSPAEPVIKTTGGLIAAESFLKGPENIGLLVCAWGADIERLAQQAAGMGSVVVGVEYCKQAKEMKNCRKCENPGRCPGQVQKILALKKAGAQAVLISNCTDCTNTVMSCAPQLGLPVYHCTDGALRAVNHKLIRKYKKEE